MQLEPLCLHGLLILKGLDFFEREQITESIPLSVPLTIVFVRTLKKVDGRRTDRGVLPPPPDPPPLLPPSAIRTANFSPEFFREGGQGGRSRSFHFKKFAKANFLKWCRGGVWGGLPPQESPLPVPCPPGGSGGLRPPGISVNYPCLASAAAVPCPRALPPIFFRPNFFVGILFVRRPSVRPRSHL